MKWFQLGLNIAKFNKLHMLACITLAKFDTFQISLDEGLNIIQNMTI